MNPTPEQLEQMRQDEIDRLRDKYPEPEPERERTINGSREWYESGHGAGDFA